MSDAIIDRNRRAVYHALTGVFQDAAVVIRAVELWERQFADQRGFRVNLYVNAVAQEIVLNDNQVRALASQLYAAMTTPERNLPQLPAALRSKPATELHPVAKPAPQSPATQSTAPQSDVSLQTGVTNPRLAVFTTLLTGLIDGATRAQKFSDFLEALDSQAPPINAATLRSRALWIKSGLTKLRAFVNTVPDDERRAIVNDLYVALCEACGPVVADRVLATSVKIAEQSPEALFCSPQTFL